MLRFVGFAGGLDKQLFRLGFGAIEIERRSRRLHGFLLVAIAVLSICTERSTAICVLSSYPDCTEEALRARPPQRYGTETAARQRMDETLTLSLCLIFIL